RPGIDIRLLYNGTPQRTVSPDDARAARAELGATEDEVVIGSFGRLQRWKGQDVFIAAGGATFGFEADYAEGLKTAAAVPELEGRVTFTGFRTDVARLMAACDVVCHTSRVPEPFGLVIVEAMALGRAVIATAGGGPSEIISSPQEGVLIAPDDPRALAATMRELIDDPDRRARLG